MRYRKTSTNKVFAFRARNTPYLRSGPPDPFSAKRKVVQGQRKPSMLRAKTCPTDTGVSQHMRVPSSGAHGARQRARAESIPSARAPTTPTTLAPGGPPSRARKDPGRWSGRACRAYGKHTTVSSHHMGTAALGRSLDQTKDLGRLRTFSQHHGHLRADGGRRPKNRPSPSALRGTEALLAVKEVGVL